MFELRLTDKNLTPWGGFAQMKRMLDHLGFESKLANLDLKKPGSNRYEHIEVTRADHVLRELFGFTRMAGHRAISRFFGLFIQAQNQNIFGALYRWLFDQIQIDRITLDLDSTVMTRYGKQEGAAKGYNPKKPGRTSHHPLMAFVSELDIFANIWLRPGNTGSANHVKPRFSISFSFLMETIRVSY